MEKIFEGVGVVGLIIKIPTWVFLKKVSLLEETFRNIDFLIEISDLIVVLEDLVGLINPGISNLDRIFNRLIFSFEIRGVRKIKHKPTQKTILAIEVDGCWTNVF